MIGRRQGSTLASITLRRYLEENRIVYRVGRDGAPWTTIEAIKSGTLAAG
jgi:hypothetical protein